MSAKEILRQIKQLGKPENIEGMSKFGIAADTAYGVPIPALRRLAKDHRTNPRLALELWDSNIHEGKLLAAFIDNPKKITEKQMNEWVNDFYSWDICDQVCSNLFDKTPYAYDKALEWCKEEKEFFRRAGFVMMAVLAIPDKKASDEKFIQFFPLIEAYSDDDRNFVKKAINWALRQIGKRNMNLHKNALALTEKIKKRESKSDMWVASDAIRELENEKIIKRIKTKK